MYNHKEIFCCCSSLFLLFEYIPSRVIKAYLSFLCLLAFWIGIKICWEKQGWFWNKVWLSGFTMTSRTNFSTPGRSFDALFAKMHVSGPVQAHTLTKSLLTLDSGLFNSCDSIILLNTFFKDDEDLFVNKDYWLSTCAFLV